MQDLSSINDAVERSEVLSPGQIPLPPKYHFRHRGLERFASAAALVVFAIAAFFAYEALTSSATTAMKTLAMGRYIERLHVTLNLVLEADAAERGYLLTGDKSYLAPVTSSQRLLAEHLLELRQLAEDDAQRKRAEKLSELAYKRLALVAELVDIRDFKSVEAAQELFETRQDELLRQQIEAVVLDMRVHEEQGIEQSLAALNTKVRNATVSLLSLVAVGGLILLTGTVLIFRSGKRRLQILKELELAKSDLEASMGQMEGANQTIRLVSRFSDSLQLCFTAEEARRVIASYANILFPEIRGSLSIINNSRNTVDVLTWWNGEANGDDDAFAPSDCLALRCGRIYQYDRHSADLACDHVSNPKEHNYVCMPLMAQGETLGIIHLDFGTRSIDRKSIEQGSIHGLAERAALAIANLKLREKLRSQSIRDPLTSLYNRRYMEECLDRELHRAKRSHTGVGVLMLDIDHFKRFNDTFGHEAGDRILQEIATTLRNCFRREDVICRYGGEELMVILPEVTSQAAFERAQALQGQIKLMRTDFRGQALGQVTISMGLALYPEHAADTENLLTAADRALYRAKHEGRDRIVVAEVVTHGSEAKPGVTSLVGAAD